MFWHKKIGTRPSLLGLVLAMSLAHLEPTLGMLGAAVGTPYAANVEAFIFDCDGVLVDSEYMKFLSWQKALATYDIPFTLEEYEPLIGHSSKNILSLLQSLKKIEIPQEVIARKSRYYADLQNQGVIPIEPVIALVKALSKEKERPHFKLALASSASKKEILQNLKQLGLSNSFDLIISGSDDLDAYSDPEGKNKPKPYIYLECAKHLQVDPAHCLVIEDTAAGIKAATSAGMKGIALPNAMTAKQDFSQAIYVMRSYRELESLKPSSPCKETSKKLPEAKDSP